LDAIHRSILKSVINDIEKQLNTTCILVSHDPVDLLSWADEIIILNQGKIIQRGSPEEVYKYPVNEYAAALFGNYIPVSSELLRLFPSLENPERRFLRPGDFEISSDNTIGVKTEIISSNFMGSYYDVEVNVSGFKLTVTNNAGLGIGQTVYISPNQKSKEQSHHLE
jgi:ABC-type Fe3+/spermidine/putrescine transport system ATPase subunit